MRSVSSIFVVLLFSIEIACTRTESEGRDESEDGDETSANETSEGRPGEIMAETPLLADDGTVAAHGWAARPYMQFERTKIQPENRPALREWEYYVVNTEKFSASFMLSGVGTFALSTPTVEDYETGIVHGPTLLGAPTALSFPADPFGHTTFDVQGGKVEYRYEAGVRYVDVEATDYVAHLQIHDSPDVDSIAVVHLFDPPGRFFYENKRLAMPASGTIETGGVTYTLPEGSLAVMDWGRGVWPSSVKWEWGHFVGEVDGHTVGINIGTVFGNDAPGSADALLVDGVLNKLGRVKWTFDTADVMAPWTFATPDGKVDLTLTPVFDDSTTLETSPTQRLQRWKAHGTITGTATMEDGTELRIDGLRGAAEYVEILW